MVVVVVGRKPVCICGESPGGILSGTHGKCGLLDCWTAGQPPRVVTGATCRAGRAVGEVSSHRASFSGHRAAGLNSSQ